MVMRNKRVESILELVERFKVCDVTHIARLYFSQIKNPIKKAQEKLSALVVDSTLKRRRNNMNSRYYYWLSSAKEPAQIQHKMILLELFVSLCERFGENNVECVPEFSRLSGIRPDAFLAVQNNQRTYLYFVEIQVSNNPFDFEKYNKAYYTNKTEKVFPEGVFPTILAVCSKPLKNECRQLNFIQLDTDLKAIGKIAA